MELRRLPDNVQLKLCASAQVNTYKKAIEELLFNSIDAKSTSIAVRINMQTNSLQVIDNGHGMTKKDLNILGQKNMTSKITNLSTLKSAPEMYGYKGEFIANLINVAQVVKITSRHVNGNETWTKTFINAKEKKMTQMSTRPSKGTTVEVKGFLYNCNIVKRGIDSTHEIQSIKSFLEQISIVHNGISISLRDDSKNEIIIKIHKRRDVYHTLSMLFRIDESFIQELTVEKSQYKVKALIGKKFNEINKHWIYLNQKIINVSSKIHKIMNGYLKKYLLIKEKTHVKSKFQNNVIEENNFNDDIPFYFLFITCPYNDYDISSTPRQSVIEFRNWDQLNKILEKVVQFYVGDVKLKPIKNPKIEKSLKSIDNMKCSKETKIQVQKIINKILGNSSKKVRVSQLQNGVKGKRIKRNSNVLETPKEIIDKKEDNVCTTHHEIISNVENKSAKKKKMGELNKDEKEKEEFKRKIKISRSKHSTNKKITKKNKIHSKVLLKKKMNDRNNVRNYPDHYDFVYKLESARKDTTEGFLNDRTKQEIPEKKKHIIKNKEPETNNLIIEKYLKHKIKNSEFKTTYDLVQTIYLTQQGIVNLQQTPNRILFLNDNYCVSNNNNQLSFDKSNIQSDFTNHLESNNEYRNFYCRKRQLESIDNNMVFTKSTRDDTYSNISPPLNSYNTIRQENIYSEMNHFETCNKQNRTEQNTIQQETSYFVQRKQTGSKSTYDSHAYYKINNVKSRLLNTMNRNNVKSRNLRFITRHSKENFIVPNEKSKCRRRLTNKPYTTLNFTKRQQYIDDDIHQTINESFSINYTKSNENNCNNIVQSVINEVNHSQLPNVENDVQPNVSQHVSFHTYVLSGQNECINDASTVRSNGYNLNIGTYSIHYSDTEEFNNQIVPNITTAKENKNITLNNFLNIVFVSNSQHSVKSIEPLNICETVISDCENIAINNNTGTKDLSCEIITPKAGPEDISHHFSNKNEDEELRDNTHMNYQDPTPKSKTHEGDVIIDTDLEQILFEENHFSFKDRLRFLPKGMSQIFENCKTRINYDETLNKDYYENTIYDNFMNDVQLNTEIYKPLIQHIDDFTTKNIYKFQNKLKDDNASLVFDQNALKNAKVLNQVDRKFIAAVINTGKNQEYTEVANYLVLFDQHAVSERIRLENNLNDYLKEDKWTSVSLDNVMLKFTKDEILYLHNYRDKFAQLGLQWTILNDNEITVNSIPEAILGKNVREVDKVIRAVRNLIIEEMNAVKLQKGCLSLYPKSIMDLVCSEACRYAIKFGDKLSKSECEELLTALSYCKTPFQCAHGRPVMAVLMDIEHDKHEYKIDMEKLVKFKGKITKKDLRYG